MSDCCIKQNTERPGPGSHPCPVNGRPGSRVSLQTILHHVNDPWCLTIKEQPYYFCGDPQCEVVYYGDDNSVFTQERLRTTVGVKQNSDESIICYCFGLTRSEARNNANAVDFVKENTRLKNCACEIRNPAGKCCLKDIQKLHESAE